MTETAGAPLTGDRLAAGPPAGDRLAARLRGFGPLGILAMLVILAGNLLVLPLSAVLALLWARRSGTPWREIGYVRPSWMAGLLIGLVFGCALKLVMKAIVMPLLGADPVNRTRVSRGPSRRRSSAWCSGLSSRRPAASSC